MTNQEILEKAIKKAIDGGWQDGLMEYALDATKRGVYEDKDWREFFREKRYNRFIFNHDFAKALWGEEKNTRTTHDIKIDNGRRMNKGDWQPDWQYHLQQMVIADDPIKYLKENI